MTTSVAAIRQASVDVSVFRQVANDYAAAHDVPIHVWRRTEEGWTVALSTSSEAPEQPGANLEKLNLPMEGELFVQVGDGDSSDQVAERTRYLATLLAREAHHHSESTFFGRELAERYEEITLLYTISEVLGSVITLEQAASTILGEVVDTMSVERAALWLYEPDNEVLHLVAAVGGDGQGGPVRIDDKGSMTATVFRNRTPMILEPGDVFPRADTHAVSSHRDSFLSVPVSYTPPRGETRTIGVINLIGRSVEEGFSAGDQKLIAAIASQIGAAVENSRLVANSLQQERMVRELELAHDLQLKLLPSVEQFQEYGDVAARCVPADSVGGDFYHLFRLPDGCVGVMIGDVSSHGFAAALIMALTMSAVAIHASEGDPPAKVLRRVHKTLIDELESTEMYLTLFYGVIDPNKGKLCYANAGHSPAFRISDDGQVERLGTTNPPFGLVDLDSYAEEERDWLPGKDLLFLFTDGLSDALDTSTGEEILTRFVAERRNEPMTQVLGSLFELEPCGTDAPSDDRTAVLVRI